MLIELAVSDNIPDREFLSQHYTLNDLSAWRLLFKDDIYTIEKLSENLSLTLDFRVGNYSHRQRNPSKEPLAQAIKIKKKFPESLIDATPGVLKDSLMLAGRGVQITAIERNPILFVMVRQALSVLPNPTCINYHFGDACDLLSQHLAPITYLDPMYPQKSNTKKSAQVKKDMQILHQIVGADSDAAQLFAVARKKNNRLVVKRPSYAEPITDEVPSFISQTGATRFDVYLPKPT